MTACKWPDCTCESAEVCGATPKRKANPHVIKLPRVTPTENQKLLKLLDGKPALWALIAAWPNVPLEGNWRHRRSPARGKMLRRWAVLAGVAGFESRVHFAFLFGHGFVRADGTVDAQTAGYVHERMVEGLPEHVKEKMYRATRSAREGGDGPSAGELGRAAQGRDERRGGRAGGAAARRGGGGDGGAERPAE